MFHFPAECPKCKKPQSFVVTSINEHLGLDEKRQIPGHKEVPLIKTYGSAACPDCYQPVLFIFKITLPQLEKAKEAIRTNSRYTAANPELIESYPPQPEYYSHVAYPENLRNLFEDLQKSLAQELSPPLIITGCRMVLEAAVKGLGAKGGNLWKQIKNLVEQNMVSELLGDWAHLIREYGNHAAHELTATPEEAKEMVEFTRIFLDYTYVLPYMINEHKK